MKRVTEKKIKVLGAKAPVAETTEVRKDDTFVLVEVSKFSINDEFMKY